MVEKKEERSLLEWLTPIAQSQMTASDVMGGRLSVLVEAGGATTGDDEAQSVAFQLEFDTYAKLKEWETAALPGISEEFDNRYPGRGMLFCSVFREVTANS